MTTIEHNRISVSGSSYKSLVYDLNSYVYTVFYGTSFGPDTSAVSSAIYKFTDDGTVSDYCYSFSSVTLITVVTDTVSTMTDIRYDFIYMTLSYSKYKFSKDLLCRKIFISSSSFSK